MFLKIYRAETTEALMDGFVSAFVFFGGVPLSVLMDNTKLAVARILPDGRRELTAAFTRLSSHYVFKERFGRPGKGNDKGKVEALVKFARRSHMTPVPRITSLDALNGDLEAACIKRLGERAGRETALIGDRLLADLAAFRRLDMGPLEACDARAGRVSSTALVRYRNVDYSVPTAYGYRDVMVKGFVDRIVISCGGEVIARHARSYMAGDLVLDLMHYLPLLEMKPGALDQAAAMQRPSCRWCSASSDV